jgi:DNA-binding PadR family transcriptional regulator
MNPVQFASIISTFPYIIPMKGTYIGEFEELVMLAVAKLHPSAYGVSIKQEILDTTNRDLSLSAVHGALNRLEEKGLLKSHLGGATPERGGKNKRIFVLTAFGTKAMITAREQREAFWKAIPKIALQGSKA